MTGFDDRSSAARAGMSPDVDRVPGADPYDTALLAEVGELFARLDPVPPDVVRAARTACRGTLGRWRAGRPLRRPGRVSRGAPGSTAGDGSSPGRGPGPP